MSSERLTSEQIQQLAESGDLVKIAAGMLAVLGEIASGLEVIQAIELHSLEPSGKVTAWAAM
jgi:hypothetical protein